MNDLDALIHDAQATATWPQTALSEAEAQVQRQLAICNGCRYCESFCPVFSAMTRRLTFAQADVHHLANLCHNCGACLHACQYAEPHEFAINIPRAMARVRAQTYAEFAWPPALGRLYQRQGLTLSLALVLALVLVMVLAQALQAMHLASGAGATPATGAGFYAVIPHAAMVALFLPVFAWSVLALLMGMWRFMRGITPATSGVGLSPVASGEAVHHALRLKHLDGGHGEGCHNEDDSWTHARKRAHHLTFYGFVLCFLATSVATLYHYVWDWPAPYDWLSLPKVLGILGGASMVAGTSWLWRLHLSRHPLHNEPSQRTMDRGFIALLFLVASTGLALMLARGSVAMPPLLIVHLACVMAFFLTMPYSKMAHGFYRLAALLRHSVEKRQPNRLGVGGDA